MEVRGKIKEKIRMKGRINANGQNKGKTRN
jgi:hypothetical protein